MTERIRGSIHLRVRWAMYGAFALIAGVLGMSGWFAERAEQRMQAASALVEYAVTQQANAQRIGRIALHAVHPADEQQDAITLLTSVLDETKGLDLRFDSALSQVLRSHGPPLEAWRRARDGLWADGEALVRHETASSGGRALSDLAVDRALHKLATHADPAFAAADALVLVLRDVQQSERDASVTISRVGQVTTLILLGLLGFWVVEPTARAVEESNRKLRQQATAMAHQALVAERTHNLVMMLGPDHRIQWINEAFTRKTGYTLVDAQGRLPSELVHSAHADEAEVQRIGAALERGIGARAELRNRGKDGQEYWVDLDVQPFRGADGEVEGFVGVETDITDQVTQRTQLESLLAALPDGVLVQDVTGRVIQVNRSARLMLDLERESLLGQATQDIPWTTVREDLTSYPGSQHPAMQTLRDGRGRRAEMLGVPTPQGGHRWFLVNTEPLFDALGEMAGVVSCLVDVTERRQLQDKLFLSARSDALTELPNRVVVTERIARAIEHRRLHPTYGFAVLFMDFDRFKQVNDTHGHGAGDRLLKLLAQRLLVTLRPGDAVARLDGETHTAARLGGDEFVVVLEGIRERRDVEVVAQRLLDALTEPYELGHTTVQSSVSIGIVVSPDGDTDAETVLRDADTAMYEAKRGGRGCFVVFDPSMHERVSAAMSLESDLRQALRSEALFVAYQPIVEMAGQTVAGVEALIRWRHPGRGMVPPVEFIPLAEEVGLIGAVGEFVLDAACRQLAAWRRDLGALAPAYVAVNLSRAQLLQPELLPAVRSALVRWGVVSGDLHLEVTESLAAQDSSVLDRMRELRALGVHLALDDFGTGYSSLACLHEMPIDTVKIDRSFVSNAETSSYHRVVIEATLRVAQALGLTSVAEGIETPEQARLMAELGCHRGQGYLFSRPQEGVALTMWLRERPARQAQSSPGRKPTLAWSGDAAV